jgi:hypothetical protein
MNGVNVRAAPRPLHIALQAEQRRGRLDPSAVPILGHFQSARRNRVIQNVCSLKRAIPQLSDAWKFQGHLDIRSSRDQVLHRRVNAINTPTTTDPGLGLIRSRFELSCLVSGSSLRRYDGSLTANGQNFHWNAGPSMLTSGYPVSTEKLI